MVLLIIIPFLNGYFIGNINPTFSGPKPYFEPIPPDCRSLGSTVWCPWRGTLGELKAAGHQGERLRRSGRHAFGCDLCLLPAFSIFFNVALLGNIEGLVWDTICKCWCSSYWSLNGRNILLTNQWGKGIGWPAGHLNSKNALICGGDTPNESTEVSKKIQSLRVTLSMWSLIPSYSR